MALPSVKITIKGGGLGRVPVISDGVAGLLLTGELTAAPTITASSTALQNVYANPLQLGSVKDLEQLKLTPSDNSTPSHAVIQKHVQDFYTIAGDGAQLWLTLLPKSGAKAAFPKVFEAGGPADKMVEQSGGRLRLLGVAHRGTTTTATDGLKVRPARSSHAGAGLRSQAATCGATIERHYRRRRGRPLKPQRLRRWQQ